MEKMVYEYAAGTPAASRALAGVVGSGDLEVLLEPSLAGRSTVVINTSVSGMRPIWETLLTRLFGGELLPAAHIEINDCGATPGVVRMRIEQAFEEASQA